MGRYPRELERIVTLADATRVTIRPIRPEDRELEQAFVQQLSPQSRYLRFLDTLTELSPHMLRHFTEIDYEKHMALIALTTSESGAPVEIGVTRYVANDALDACEFAIVVADRWQHRGLGAHLLQALIDVARARGLTMMYGDVLASNTVMLRFVSRQGFVIEPHPEDRLLRRAVLELRSAAAAQ